MGGGGWGTGRGSEGVKNPYCTCTFCKLSERALNEDSLFLKNVSSLRQVKVEIF